jgi:hypothetical protein
VHALSFSGSSIGSSSLGSFNRAPQFGAISSDYQNFRDDVRKRSYGEKPAYEVRNPWGIPEESRDPLSALLELAQNAFRKKTYYPEILNMIVQKGLRRNRDLFEENREQTEEIVTQVARQFGGPEEFARALDLISKSFGDQCVPDVIMEPLRAAFERVLQEAPIERKAQARTSRADTGLVLDFPLVA